MPLTRMPWLAVSGASATVPPGADSTGPPLDARVSVSARMLMVCPAGTARPPGMAPLLPVLPMLRGTAVATVAPPSVVVNGAPARPIPPTRFAAWVSDTDPALPVRLPVARLPPVCMTLPVVAKAMLLTMPGKVASWPARTMPPDPAARARPDADALPRICRVPAGSRPLIPAAAAVSVSTLGVKPDWPWKTGTLRVTPALTVRLRPASSVRLGPPP